MSENEYFPAAVPLPDERNPTAGRPGVRPDPGQRRNTDDAMAQSIDPAAHPPERIVEENDAMSANPADGAANTTNEDTVLSDPEAAQMAHGTAAESMAGESGDGGDERGGAAPAVGP
ncbi:MAG: hypothetical protein M3P48_09055 [Actinomycetota bacterium]|nr:hypothetical protein [Actinomycetota bacterium]